MLLWKEGEVTSRVNSPKFLEEFYNELSIKLEEINKGAIRDRKLDFSLMPKEDLLRKLKKSPKEGEKKLILLTEVGYLRINLFHEYYERIQVAQKNRDFGEAVELMKDYVETIAMPFLQQKLHPSVLDRVGRFLYSNGNPDAGKTMQDWLTGYEAWSKKQGSAMSDSSEKLEMYNGLKRSFIVLYTLSFSYENFPPVVTEPSH